MPWQRQVADTALEIDPETGRLAYREVVVLVPRQSGKTTLLLPTVTHRCLSFGGEQGCLYISHQRQKALAKWKEEQVPKLQRSEFGRMFRPSLQTGNEAIHWDNGSRYGIDAPTQDAGHSLTLDLVTIDEAWRVPAAVEAGIGPTMITRPEPQRWVISTAGTPASKYLRAKVDRGRKDPDIPGIAYFEWGAPDDADPHDEDLWWDTMPALGFTQTIEAMRAEYLGARESDDPSAWDSWCRAYLNQWRDGIALAAKLPAWPGCLVEAPLPAAGRPVLGFDAWAGRWTVVAAWRLGDRVAVEVVDDGADVTAGAARLVDLSRRHVPLSVCVDTYGPVASAIPQLVTQGLPVKALKYSDQADGWSHLKGETASTRIAHVGDPRLADSIQGVATRKIRDREAIDRASSASDPSPLVAAVEAVWGVETTPPPPTVY